MPYATDSDKRLRINCMGNDRTIIFAADELRRCLRKMIGRDVPVGVKSSVDLEDGGITIGLCSALPFLKMPEAPDPAMDDAIRVDIRDGAGFITGINPRSVLLAVYRYLTVIGCRWVRPGADGEQIPACDVLPDVQLSETASYRHRGVCIEGAVSYEHVRDMIDWIPKLGFNAYFIQFREGHTFFNRWYAHQGNPLMEGREITVDEARVFTSDAVDEMRKRGMMYHAVGHGWTCEPFGIPGLGWDDRKYDVPADSMQYLALVNGKRELWYGIPLNTNLCYSNPKARELVTDDIAHYVETNPAVDVLHFWLADGSNNNCECEECAKARPSDFYVRMLNELDAKLTARGLNTQVVFLVYVDLLWPPVTERIENPDRFILMFAPITRTYTESFKPSDELPALPPFERNKLAFSKDVNANVAFLKAWQASFPGDSFDFDYHLMWDHVNDPGHAQISDIISQDMKALKSLGLNGFVSCQVQRVFLPTALPMVVMGRTLWDTSADLAEISNDYFETAFGDDGMKCRDYLTELSRLFDPPYMRGEKPVLDESAAARFRDAVEVIDGFMDVIERNRACGTFCHRKSWDYLRRHAEINTQLAKALEARASGDAGLASELWAQVKQMALEREPILHPVLDVQLFINVMGGKF